MAFTTIKTNLIANNAITQSKINPSVQIGGGGASVTTSNTAPESPSTGDLWYNPSNKTLNTYYNSSWVITNTQMGIGSRVVDTFTASANQTTFTTSSGYSIGYVDVYINGIKLLPSDFTATNSTTIILDTVSDANDEVTIISWTLSPGVASFTSDIFTANGAQTSFTLSTTPSNENQTTVVIDGVTQIRNVYSVNGSLLTFSEAPANNSVIEITTARTSANVISYNDLSDKPDLSNVSGGPKITNIEITNSGGTVLDDTAVDITGGYIKLTGTGFASGCQVIINNIPATSTTFVNSTTVRAQLPATAAGTYIVYLVNTDGGVAIRVNGVTFSGTPSWVTGSSLSGDADSSISIQLSASNTNTYSLQAGSTLPTGLTLTSGGLLSGTVTGLEQETVYSFTILATDTENQDSPRTFSITISVGEPYFYLNSLLLSSDGTNNANNNVFVDSSNNNFAITRNGNATQGSFSPFSPAGWSNYFDGTGDYLDIAHNTNLTFPGDFTVEFWAYPTSGSGVREWYSKGTGFQLYSNATAWWLALSTNNTSTYFLNATFGTLVPNQWQHIVVTRSGNSYVGFVNGVATAIVTSASAPGTGTSIVRIGDYADAAGYAVLGYISNVRFVQGTAVYGTTNFTPPTAPLTAVANTQLLTCQANRLIDNSTNAFTITNNGDTKVVNFSPFKPTAAYSTVTHGGSGYFDGTGDDLTTPSNAAFTYGTGDFTIEGFFFFTGGVGGSGYSYLFAQGSGTGITSLGVYIQAGVYRVWNGSAVIVGTTAYAQNRWVHIALARSGTSLRLFVNGVLDGSATNSNSIATGSTIGISVGRWAEIGDTNWITGYVSNFRVVKGTAVYTGAFTPPTTPVTAIANTSLLLNFTNAGIYDATSKNILETVGDSKISTTQSKFGGSSMYFDGTGDYLSLPSNLLFAFGTGDFTIEFWAYPNDVSVATQRGPLQISSTAGGLSTSYTSGIIFYFGYNSNGGLLTNVLGTNVGNGSAGMTTGNWYHIAAVRSSGVVNIYLNGISIASATVSGNFTGTNLVVGGYYSTAYLYNGYMDDLRISRYARYTTNFTPPTSAHRLR